MRFAPLFLILFLVPFMAHAILSRTLSFGSQGEDVRELQVLLIRDPETRVAVSGPGSLGFESSYFGALT